MTETEKSAALQKHCIMLYAVYALSSVMQFFELTLLPGLLALIMAYYLSFSKKSAAEGTPYASHLRWLSRTFWIGTGVIVPVAVIIAAVLIWMFTDFAAIASSMTDGDRGALMGSVQTYMKDNMTKISTITMLAAIPTVAWWMRRCWIGYTLAKEGKPVENVTSWL